MTLRRLGPEDWALFRDIRLEMLRNDPRAFGSSHVDWAAKTEGEVREWLTSMRCFAVIEGAIAQSVAAWHRFGGAITAHRGSVISAYTRPAARGRGHFARVLQAVEVDAENSGLLQLELDVAEENTPAIIAYRNAGFLPTGRIPRALHHDGQYLDAITMMKRLDRA